MNASETQAIVTLSLLARTLDAGKVLALVRGA